MKYRAIQYAIDELTGVLLDADELFYKDGYAVRDKYQKGHIKPVCEECYQPLQVSTSSKHNIHFRHNPKSEYCDLKDVDYSEEEFALIYHAIAARESPRHKALKQKISEGLKLYSGVEGIEEEKTLILNGSKRRPDVYCRYNGRQIVFEVQLSQLPLRYIHGRNEFYKNNGIYIIWILENTQLRGPLSVTQRDIKYSSFHQNFFRVDESRQALRLKCDYKTCFIVQETEIHYKWKNIDAELGNLQFAEDSYQVYYHNFKEEEAKLETVRQTRLMQIRQKRKEELDRLHQLRELKREQDVAERVTEYVDVVKKLLQKDPKMFWPDAIYKFKSLSDPDIIFRINDVLKFETDNMQYLISKLIDFDNNWAFIRFILKCPKIGLPLEKLEYEGKPLLLHWIENGRVRVDDIGFLLNRRYRIKQQEKELCAKYKNSDKVEERKKAYFVEFYEEVGIAFHIDELLDAQEICFDLASIRDNKVIHKSYSNNGMIQLMHTILNAESKKPYHYYHLKALREYERMDEIIAKDATGKFAQKIELAKKNLEMTDTRFQNIIFAIFSMLDTQ